MRGGARWCAKQLQWAADPRRPRAALFVAPPSQGDTDRGASTASGPAPIAAHRRNDTVLVFAAILAVFAAHGVLSWGHVGQYWGDSGRWMYEVDRSVHGARVYRDVYWGFPPFAMWVMTAAGRWLGTNVTQIWTVTAAITCLLGIAYSAVVAQLLPLRLALPAGIAGASLGVAYASNGSPPLVSGMYSPAVPIAALIAFTQLALVLQQWRSERPSLPLAAAIGALAGAGLLTKHDVWIPCLVMAAATVLAPKRSVPLVPRLAAVALGLLGVSGAGVWILASNHGVDQLPAIFTGYGQMQEFGRVFLPSMSQVTVQGAALGIALVFLRGIALVSGVLSVRRAAPPMIAGLAMFAGAAIVWLSVAEFNAQEILKTGEPALPTVFQSYLLPVAQEFGARSRSALAALRFELLRQVLPVALTALVLLIAWMRRRHVHDRSNWQLLCVLLVLVLAFNARRQLAFTEWTALMLAAPVYAFATTVLWRWPAAVLQRTVTFGCALLLVCAALAHHRFGFGVGTQRGRLPTVSTARGVVRLAPGSASDFNMIRGVTRAIDPSGRRPLLAFGYSAGHNYLLGRPGVGALTHGFRISLYPTADSAHRVAAAEHDRLLLIDSPVFEGGVPAIEWRPWRWQPRMIENPYVSVDRPLFERLLRGCRRLSTTQRSVFTIYDCAPASDSILVSTDRTPNTRRDVRGQLPVRESR